MEISVSRLNNRMALQVPSELPLGLVFITGRVGELKRPGKQTEKGLVAFELTDEVHQLSCRVPPQVVEETQVESGDRIRVSGHLLFDSHSVQYYLLARDLDVLPAVPVTEAPDPSATTPSIREKARAASLVQAELPSWVKQLAPQEIQAELGLLPEPAKGAEEDPLASPSLSGAAAEAKADALPAEMLSFLSSAIDSDEDIELTQEMIRDYLSAERDEERRSPTGSGNRVAATVAATPPTIGEEVSEEGVRSGGRTEAPTTEDVGEVWNALSASSSSAEKPSKRNSGERWVLAFIFLLILLIFVLLAFILWDLVGIDIMQASVA